MSEPVLSVRDLRVAFPTRRRTLIAVDGVSFDIAAGEVLGVVGESGAGKSLTGAAVIGLLEPPGRIIGGEVRLKGRRIAGAALDVYDVEPLPKDHPFLRLDNVVLTPHLGYGTEEAFRTVYAQAVETIRGFLDGKPVRPINTVT